MLNQTYSATAHPRQVLDFYPTPLASPEKPAPLVVDIHGGGWISGDKGSLGVADTYRLAGFHVAKINYRLATDTPWPAQIEDTKAALRYLKSRATELLIAPERVVLIGHSAGSTLGILAALSADTGRWTTAEYPGVSERIRAVVAQAAVADLAARHQLYLTTHSPRVELHQRMLAALFPGTATPDLTAAGLSCHTLIPAARHPTAFLLAAAELDQQAPPAHLQHLHHALLSSGWISRYKLLTGEDHNSPRFWQPEHVAEALAFFTQATSSP